VRFGNRQKTAPTLARIAVNVQAAAIGSIRPGPLFLTLPTRGLTGQQIISPEG
jgi:hypothetical protein